MLETELKCMLDKSAYERLRKMFEWDYVKEQVNNYYTDEKNELRKNNITLRVRTKDGINKVQVKQHKNPGSPLQICEEKEFNINSVPEYFSEDETQSMTGLRVRAVLLGSLSTLRHSLMYTDNVEICLDKSSYLDQTDYELEIEYTGEIPQKLHDILHGAGVTFTEASIGKCSRFMLRLSHIMQGE